MKILYTAVVLLISSLGYAQVEPNGEEENDNCFHNVSTDQDIPITLVVRKQPNLICFPQDDGYDSITRTFHVQNYGYSDLTSAYDNGVTLMEGTFRVFGEGLSDSIEITVDHIDRTPPPSPVEQIDITNFENQGTTISIQRIHLNTLRTYRGMWLDWDYTSLKCLQGKLLYTISGEAIFQYSYCEQENGEYVTIERDLRGRKL